MIQGFNIKTIEDADIQNKHVLVRVDYNVTLTDGGKIADDLRMRQSLQTLEYLLVRGNRLILIAHLGQPKNKDMQFSLAPIARHLQELLPHYTVTLVDDFEKQTELFKNQEENQLLLLENLRFYPGEKQANQEFGQKLAHLGDIFVQDAFGVLHRKDTSVMILPKLLPSYAGLLVKKEIEKLSVLTTDPAHPYVAILGGAKLESKLPMLYKLVEIADTVLVGGVLANTLLAAQGVTVGQSKYEQKDLDEAGKIVTHAKEKNTQLVLPTDVIVADPQDSSDTGHAVQVTDIPAHAAIYDIGPETQDAFTRIVNAAKTIVWTGPLGYTEREQFRHGTQTMYYAITQNTTAFSVVGGGDTIAALPKTGSITHISHLSTGGGAMIEFIEKGTLPGLTALTGQS